MNAAKQSTTAQPAAKAQAAASVAPLAAPFGVLARQLGNANLRRVLQAKLTVSHPQDMYEQEADRVADQVMRMPETQTVARSPLQIQRLCDRCEEELHRSEDSTSAVPTINAETENSIASLSTRGSALPPALRSFMEPRFNADFSVVRIHNDAHAHALARSVNAKAFTVGHNVVFGAGQYSPDTESGKRLLAHELTHTLQQGAASLQVARAPEKASASTTHGAAQPEQIPYQYKPIYLRSDTPNHLAREGSDLLLKHHVMRGKLGQFTLIVVTDRVYIYLGSAPEAPLAAFDLTAPPPIRGMFMGGPPGPRYYLSYVNGKASFGWFGHWGRGEWVTQYSKIRDDELNELLKGTTPVVIVPGGLVQTVTPKKGTNPGGGGTQPSKPVPPPSTAAAGKEKKAGALEGAPSGDEYTGDDTKVVANYPAFPADIELSTRLVPAGGANDLTMHLHWESGEYDVWGPVWNASTVVDYAWEQWDVTEILKKMDREALASTRRQTRRDKAARVEDQYAEHDRHERVDELAEQVEDSRRTIAMGGTPGASDGERLHQVIIENANLGLAPISALRSAGGHQIDKAWHSAARPDNQIRLEWKKSGTYLVRCIAAPREHEGRRYAQSVATQFVEVRPARYIAENTLDMAEDALLKLYIERVTARDPRSIKRLDERIKDLAATARGSAVEALEVAVKNTQAELATAGGSSERRRLQTQMDALSTQLEIARRTESGLPPGPDGKPTHALRPKAAIVSQVTGTTFPLWLQLFQVSGGAHPKWVIYDVSSKGDYLGRGHFGEGSSNGEAIEHAFLDFAGANEYGRGTVVMDIPASIPDVERRELVEKNFNRGDDRARERLQDLVTVLTAAGIVVPGAAGVAMVLGGALAVDHIITRWRNGTLELDGALITDLLSVLSAVGYGAGRISRLMVRKVGKAFAIATDSGNLAAIEKTLAKVKGAHLAAELIGIGNEILTYGGIAWGEHQMLTNLETINDLEQAGSMTHSAASIARSRIVLGALQNHTFLFAGLLHAPRGLNVEPSPRVASPENPKSSEPTAKTPPHEPTRTDDAVPDPIHTDITQPYPKIEAIGEYTFSSQKWNEGETVHWRIWNWSRKGGPNRGKTDLAPLRFLRQVIASARATGGKTLVLTVENISAPSVQRTDRAQSTLWKFLGASSVERIDDKTLRIVIPLEAAGPKQSGESPAGAPPPATGFEDNETTLTDHPFADIPTIPGIPSKEPTRTFYRFADITDPQTMTSRAGLSPESAAAAAAIPADELQMRAEAHGRLGLVQHSPFVALGESIEALANSPDKWLSTIATGRPGMPGVKRAPFILIFEIPESRVFRLMNSLSQKETEWLFLGEDLIDFLVGAMPNPYN